MESSGGADAAARRKGAPPGLGRLALLAAAAAALPPAALGARPEVLKGSGRWGRGAAAEGGGQGVLPRRPPLGPSALLLTGALTRSPSNGEGGGAGGGHQRLREQEGANNHENEEDEDEEKRRKKRKGEENEKAWHEDSAFLAKVMLIALPLVIIGAGFFECMHQHWAGVKLDTELPEVPADANNTNLCSLFSGISTLIQPYFRNSARSKGQTYVAAVLVLNACIVFVSVAHNTWEKEWWDTFEKKHIEQFDLLVTIFALLITLWVIFNVYMAYLQQMLSIDWREFMTRHFVRRWLADGAFHVLQLDGELRQRVENPDQRIQEDVNMFVSSTISISSSFVHSFGHLFVFVPILLRQSPTKAFGSFYCPGWLLYLAVLYALLGTIVTHIIGHKLIPVEYAQQQYEANFRFGLVRVRDSAASIALHGGARREEAILAERFEHVKTNYWHQMFITKRMAYFTSFFGMAQFIIPFFVLGPSYFKGEISMGRLFQLRSALQVVCTSLEAVMKSYGDLATWRATSDRLMGFSRAIADAHKMTKAAQTVYRKGPPGGLAELDRRDEPLNLAVATRGLTVSLPTRPVGADCGAGIAEGGGGGGGGGGAPLWKDLDLSIPRGKRVLITGTEGVGKSILFQALGQCWPYISAGQVWLNAGGEEEEAEAQAEMEAEAEVATPEAARHGAKDDAVGNVEVGSYSPATGGRVLFLPQRPYFPAYCTLRGALSYPSSPKSHSDEALLAALRAVRLDTILEGELAAAAAANAAHEEQDQDGAPPPPPPLPKGPRPAALAPKGRGLDVEADWGHLLSPGQQQRLAFARALLFRPRILFLDEACSNIGLEGTLELYGLLHTCLAPEATLVSISHEVQLLAPLHDVTFIVQDDATNGRRLDVMEAPGGKRPQ